MELSAPMRARAPRLIANVSQTTVVGSSLASASIHNQDSGVIENARELQRTAEDLRAWAASR